MPVTTRLNIDRRVSKSSASGRSTPATEEAASSQGPSSSTPSNGQTRTPSISSSEGGQSLSEGDSSSHSISTHSVPGATAPVPPRSRSFKRAPVDPQRHPRYPDSYYPPRRHPGNYQNLYPPSEDNEEVDQEDEGHWGPPPQQRFQYVPDRSNGPPAAPYAPQLHPQVQHPLQPHSSMIIHQPPPDPYSYYQQPPQQLGSPYASHHPPFAQGYFPSDPYRAPTSPSMPMVPYQQFYPPYWPPAHHRSRSPERSPPPPAQPDPELTKAADEKIKKLEEMLKLQEKQAAAREAAEKAFKEEQAAKEAMEKAKAEAVSAATAKAKEAAEKAAEEKAKKAAEEHEKALKKAKEAEEKAEKAKKAAEDEAAKLKPPDDDKQPPIKFKDAVGRKFSFPWKHCKTWKGMDDLIQQAFMHVEVLGEHVRQGHYDLHGPDGEIVLPPVWESVVRPDWSITMNMWPMMEEKPKDPLPPPPIPGMGGFGGVFGGMEPEQPRKHKGREGKKKGSSSRPQSMNFGGLPPGALPPPPPMPGPTDTMHNMPGMSGIPVLSGMSGMQGIPGMLDVDILSPTERAEAKKKNRRSQPSGILQWMGGGGIRRRP